MSTTHTLQNHLTVSECADAAEVSRTAIYKAIDNNRIKVVLVGRKATPFISPRELSLFIKKRTSSK